MRPLRTEQTEQTRLSFWSRWMRVLSFSADLWLSKKGCDCAELNTFDWSPSWLCVRMRRPLTRRSRSVRLNCFLLSQFTFSIHIPIHILIHILNSHSKFTSQFTFSIIHLLYDWIFVSIHIQLENYIQTDPLWCQQRLHKYFCRHQACHCKLVNIATIIDWWFNNSNH